MKRRNDMRKGKPRFLFTDGWNSFWHFVFGMLTIRFLFILPLFVLYQWMDYNDVNLVVDLVEYFIGLFIMIWLVYGK